MSAIIIRGDLSARRPGSERTRKPVRLPAERLRHGAFLISRHAGRRFVRRDLVAGIVSRVRSGSDAGALNHGRSAPLNFSGSARVKLRQKSPRCIRQALHLQNSFRDALASEKQKTTEGIPDERKPTARDGNLTARERKNAC